MIQRSLLIFFAAIILFIVLQLLIIYHRGTPVAVPKTDRAAKTVGTGPPLRYVVMGDSTAVSQGSEYESGYAVASVTHLAKRFQVNVINTGVSGATAESVSRHQLEAAMKHRPDLVLIAVGANDATHFTRGSTIENWMQRTIDGLKEANPAVKIIVTGSPAMDSVSRFPVGAKQLMGLRTTQVNKVFERLIANNNLIHAPIAEKTRDAFLADPTLTASDQFHPNARGYALWNPVINDAIDRALAR